MQIGKSVHIDPGTLAGVGIAIVGAIPELSQNEVIRGFFPEKLGHLLQIVGIVIAAVRGQAIRRQQVRVDEAQPEVAEKIIEDK